ncbi:MAG TPA: class I SAM-dependent methyltransferase [Rhodocyclaceae bacterium]|nr:class I SAM-dependent methyltransferase [Rhodocyclaceae bacterium]
MSASAAYTGRDNLNAMRAARRYNAAILGQLLANLEGSRVLDFGAGDGLFASLMRDCGKAPVCIEPDEVLRAGLTAEGFDARPSLEGIAPGSLDAIYTINVLEHIDDDVAVLDDLRRTLRPGGRLFVFVPAWPVLYSQMDRQVGHRRRYRKDELGTKLRAAGWQPEVLRHFDSVGFLAALAYRAIGTGDGNISSASVAFYDRWVFPLSRIADRLLCGITGKNLIAVARNP